MVSFTGFYTEDNPSFDAQIILGSFIAWADKTQINYLHVLLLFCSVDKGGGVGLDCFSAGLTAQLLKLLHASINHFIIIIVVAVLTFSRVI